MYWATCKDMLMSAWVEKFFSTIEGNKPFFILIVGDSA
jgi:hypothetical protein